MSTPILKPANVVAIAIADPLIAGLPILQKGGRLNYTYSPTSQAYCNYLLAMKSTV